MNKYLIIFMLTLLPAITYSQTVGIKSNIFYDAATTLNLGVEIAFDPKTTLDISGNYNPWKFANRKQFKHWLIQPEFRWWFCETFNGSFIGLHAIAGGYNIGGIKIPFKLYKGLGEHRYQGNMYGGGIAYGYQWILSSHWGIEASIGVGYMYIKYDRYPRGNCGNKLGNGHKNYFGPTKLALSFIYII